MISATPAPQEPLTCTVKAAAQVLGLSNDSMYKLLDAGDVKSGYTSTGRRLVHLDSLREYVKELPAERPRRDGAA